MTSGHKQTCLNEYHKAHGARMAVFAGYEMPLSYPIGSLQEHLACRQTAALFDVSHMAQLDLHHSSGHTEPILRALEGLIPANLIDLPEHHQRYGLLLNDAGGILDDLMVMHMPRYVRLVVNAACAEKDIAWLQAPLTKSDIQISWQSRALIALQGPAASAALARVVSFPADLKFMQIAASQFSGQAIELSRSGYTGEDGFEVSLPEAVAESFVEAMCEDGEVKMAGLVARDSLRLEAGLCLYGQDMDADITACGASLEWAIAKIRRAGGKRQGGFIGAEASLRELAEGAEFCRIGVRAPKGVPPRSGSLVFDAETDGNQIGIITSGAPAPSVGQPVAMVRLNRIAEEQSLPLFAEVRGRRLALERADMPFFPHRFYRGAS